MPSKIIKVKVMASNTVPVKVPITKKRDNLVLAKEGLTEYPFKGHDQVSWERPKLFVGLTMMTRWKEDIFFFFRFSSVDWVRKRKKTIYILTANVQQLAVARYRRKEETICLNVDNRIIFWETWFPKSNYPKKNWKKMKHLKKILDEKVDYLNKKRKLTKRDFIIFCGQISQMTKQAWFSLTYK